MTQGFHGWPTIESKALPYANIQDQRASGTSGGTFTSGSWQTRTLQTIVTDTIGLAPLASNQIKLPAGSYEARVIGVAAACDRHQVRLQNVSDGTTLVLGHNAFAPASGTQENPSSGSGRFRIDDVKLLELQHRCQTTRSTDGFGFSASWGTEVFAIVEFWKIG